MFYHAKNAALEMDDTVMEYISFGNGEKNAILIPGLGDGLQTVKGKAAVFACLYHEFAQGYTVYAFSRKEKLKEGCTTRDMAADIKCAMDKLGIEKADIVGVSQGGMIAQFMAIDYPQAVHKLVLVVTAPKVNPVMKDVVEPWIQFGYQEKYYEIMVDTAEKMYTEELLKRLRKIYPILARMNSPKDPDRFIIMAKACLTHDASNELYKIKAPTFIIGGKKDQIVTGEASECLAEQIADSELYLYEEYGHGLYEEAKDFNHRVQEFLT